MDDDVLALLALGEEAGSADERAHVASCDRCAHELTHLRELVAVARAAQADGPLVAPAAHVWDRVADELGLDPAPVALADGPAGAPADAAPTAPAAARPDATVSTDARVAPVVPLRPRRRWAWVAGAAAAGLVVGGVGTWWVTARTPDATVVARATLDALPGWDAEGSAALETTADGTRVLVVDVEEAEARTDGYREVWLLRPDVSGLVSLGPLTGTSGRFPLPDDLDVDEFPVVDVSAEPLDGDPAHSGDSVVRGTLGT